MPTYDYRCTKCGFTFAATHGIAARRPLCTHCGAVTEQIFLTAPAVHGSMARGRELAARSLDPRPATRGHGAGCPCCH
jgi:putative FmdB family regulatory protein